MIEFSDSHSQFISYMLDDIEKDISQIHGAFDKMCDTLDSAIADPHGGWLERALDEMLALKIRVSQNDEDVPFHYYKSAIDEIKSSGYVNDADELEHNT